MAKQVLVFGGTRYFGKRLVHKLLESGDSVTIATRGTTPDPFANQVKRIKVDRENPESLRANIKGSWDVVYDQVCYSPSAAMDACEVFKGRVGRYIHTSTQAVYVTEGLRKEEHFDPWTYPIQLGHRQAFSYGEGKRLAEAVFFQKAAFPVAAVRLPIVLGMDDYTGRLEFHIDRIRSGKPIYLSNPAAEACFIDSEEAGSFLFWLKDQISIKEPINACSTGKVSIMEVIHLVEKAVDKKAVITPEGREEDHSPFVNDSARYLENSKARALGFEFKSLLDWLPDLVRQMAAARS